MGPRLRACPACRALLDPHEGVCPYCGENLGRPSVRRVELGTSIDPGRVTAYIIGACVVFFILEMVAAAGAEGSKGPWNALLGVPVETLFQMGARSGAMVARGQWWRLIVPVFLHGSLLHLAFNAIALAQVGPLAEQAYGRARFCIIFLISGVAGNVAGLVWYGAGGVGVGASGALFGLIGAAGLYGHRRGDSFGLIIRRVMVQWGLYALVFGFLMRADNAAHLGGLVSGLVFSFVLGHDEGIRNRAGALWSILAGIAVAVTLLAFGLAVVAFTAYGH